MAKAEACAGASAPPAAAEKKKRAAVKSGEGGTAEKEARGTAEKRERKAAAPAAAEKEAHGATVPDAAAAESCTQGKKSTAAAGGCTQSRKASAAADPRAAAPPHGVMSAAEVLVELSDIAAARPDGVDGAPVKVADRLKALEMLRRYHEQAAGQAADGESLTIRLEVLDGTDP